MLQVDKNTKTVDQHLKLRFITLEEELWHTKRAKEARTSARWRLNAVAFFLTLLGTSRQLGKL